MTSAQHNITLPSMLMHALDKDLSKLALVVVDMQNMFVAEGQSHAFAYARGIVPRISSLAEAVRERQGTVVWLRHTVETGGVRSTKPWFETVVGSETVENLKLLKPGAQEWEIYGQFDVKLDDIVSEKYRASAFLPDWSGLHERLQKRGIEDLMIVGCVTNFCCQSTARDAAMLDYRVFFVSDATAAHTDEIQNATLTDLASMRFFDIRTTRELLSAMGCDGPSVPS